jgi:hypothetical protein
MAMEKTHGHVPPEEMGENLLGHPASDAIRAIWELFAEQRDGLSSKMTGSRSYSIISQLISEKLVAAGIDSTSIRMNETLSLPGSYGVDRPWDIVLVVGGIPVAAIEIVIQVGRFASNNFGNRTSEFLSMAADVNRPYDVEELRQHKPCLGIVFILEETREVTAPLRRRQGLMSASMNPDADTSLRDRYAAFFQRLLGDLTYDAICYLSATPLPDIKVSEPSEDMSFERFIDTIVQRAASVASLNEDRDLTSVKFGKLLALRDDLGRVMTGLTSTPVGLSAAEHAVIERRRQLVRELIAMSLAPDVNETKMHTAISNHYWLFGGQYVGVAARRDLMPLDEHDIPLLCADGSLEIVELKGPEASIVKRYRNHLIVSAEVHDAVSQCISYLRTIDELGAALRTTHRNEIGHDYDYRRARGVVVIGHPDRVRLDGVSRENVDQAIRSYNAHLSRVRVVTYADLLESAERALRFEREVNRDN